MRPGRHLSSFTREEVNALFSHARAKVKVPGLRILRAPASLSFGRVLIVIPRKVGNSPERNLIRRRVRSIYREDRLYTYGYDCILLVRPECRSLPFHELRRLLHCAVGHPAAHSCPA